jgi:broad specificity phosphatase PhoE
MDNRDVTIYVSPLGRVWETAEIVRKYVPVAAPVREPRIREVTIGSWDGLTHEDIDADWPGMLHGSDRFNWYFRAPNGEAYDQGVNRVVTWLAEVQGTVVAVSHGPRGLSRSASPGGPVTAGAARYRLAARRPSNRRLEGDNRRVDESLNGASLFPRYQAIDIAS